MKISFDPGVAAPYPGLRPFQQDESVIFFGRNQQIDEVLLRLKSHQFLGVVGTSGCGKSSLIRAGVLPALQSGSMGDVGSSWFIADMKPGDSPLMNLARSLIASGVFGDRWFDKSEHLALLTAALRRSDVSLVNLVQQMQLPPFTNLLVLADQFEEIFRFQQNDPSEAIAFVNLLLTTGRDRTAPIYVVLTMRTDFLGQCALFPDLPEALNDALYLCPRLSRDQLAEAIKGPASVFGAQVERSLVTQLVIDAGANSDQLPLVQHVLSRMWNNQFGDGHATVTERKDRILRLTDYQHSGGLNGYTKEPAFIGGRGYHEVNRLSYEFGHGDVHRQNALSAHADEAYLSLGDEQPESRSGGPDHQPSRQQKIAEMLFRSLAARSPSGQYVRHPMKLQDVAEIAGCSVEDLVEVVDVFRRNNRNFLMPAKPPGAAERDASDLTSETMLDISHEALVRQWQRFGGLTEKGVEVGDSTHCWLTREDLCRRRFRRIVEAADSEQTAGLLHDPELSFLNKWWNEFQPGAAWANGYIKDSYDRTDSFRKRSLAQSDADRAAKAAEQQLKLDEAARLENEKHRRRALITLVGLCVAGVILVSAFAGFAAYQWAVALDEKNNAINALNLKSIAEKEVKSQTLIAEKEKKRAEGYKRALLENPGTPWPSGSTLHARFLDGDPVVQEKVKRYVNEWTQYANLRIEFGTLPNADIRISFDQKNASWAYIGTRVLSVPDGGPSVNLGFLTRNTPEKEVARYVLHEFGHVLGMIHEHQNPNATIQWNHDAVYAYFSGPPNLWARDQIDSLILQQYTVEVLPHYKDKPYDPHSIMQYTFPSLLTLDGTEFHQGSSLSEGDKAFARKLYPR